VEFQKLGAELAVEIKDVIMLFKLVLDDIKIFFYPSGFFISDDVVDKREALK